MKQLFSFLRKNSQYLFLILLFSLISFQNSLAQMRAPYETTPVLVNVQAENWTQSQVVFSSMILFYSKIISPLDGPRSPSYPTGSAYGLQAIRQEGIFMGILLIGDRLFHEADIHQGAYFKIYNRTRYYDPIENNTFWWKNQ